MIKIESIAKDFLAKHGPETTAKVSGASLAVVSGWEDGRKTQPTLPQLSALLAYDPDPINAVKPLVPEPTAPGGRLAILMQTNRQIHWQTMQSIMKLYDSAKIQCLINYSNFLVRGRNVLARKFLQTDCEWSLWVDDDMILQCGDAAWFKAASQCPQYPTTFAGINTVGALISSGKTLVGGCYFARQPGGRALFNEAYATPEANLVAHNGPRSDVLPTKWVATGCMLVHRSVYEDIIRQALAPRLSPEEERGYGYEFGFFDQLSSGLGEDQSFCSRAEKAGHQPHVDFRVMPAHVGQSSFSFFNTRTP